MDEYQANMSLLKSNDFTEENSAIVSKWLTAVGKPHKVATEDLLECFQALESGPDRLQQDRALSILMSGELRDWLRSTTSKLLLVEIRSDRDEYFTAASYASTLLIRTIQRIGTFPVLYYYCVPRTMDPKNGKLAGGTGMLIAFIGQLLRYLQGDPGCDLQFLKSKKRRFDRVVDNVHELLHIFKKLVSLLRNDQCLYMVIDSVWKLQLGANDDSEAVTGLFKLINREGLFVKLFVTDPFSEDIAAVITPQPGGGKETPTNEIGGRVINLHVPERVETGVQGINASWVEKEIADMMDECSSDVSEEGSE